MSSKRKVPEILEDGLTVSEVELPPMVAIIKESDPPGFPERGAVPEQGLEHWLKQGWSIDADA